METIELNVYGRSINVDPNAKVTLVEKKSDSRVAIITHFQDGTRFESSVDVMHKYQQTADEFIKEFNKQIGLKVYPITHPNEKLLESFHKNEELKHLEIRLAGIKVETANEDLTHLGGNDGENNT